MYLIKYRYVYIIYRFTTGLLLLSANHYMCMYPSYISIETDPPCWSYGIGFLNNPNNVLQPGIIIGVVKKADPSCLYDSKVDDEKNKKSLKTKFLRNFSKKNIFC